MPCVGAARRRTAARRAPPSAPAGRPHACSGLADGGRVPCPLHRSIWGGARLQGNLRVVVDAEDGFATVQWAPRAGDGADFSGVEEELMVFPGEARFEVAGNPASRVVVLKYGAGPKDKRVFWWLQVRPWRTRPPGSTGNFARLLGSRRRTILL